MGGAAERMGWAGEMANDIAGDAAADGGASFVAPAETPIYRGVRWRLFGLALGRMLVTILTLGIGRFWMTTRLRRFYWSSIFVDGAPLEYTGRAVELLIGFLVAVIILAAYLLVVNLGLAFVGLSVFQGNFLALQLPLLAIFPVGFWAQYRARRYILARTRWRGIRFGLEPGAWGYSARATGLWLLTVLTGGFLYPFLQWRLAKYATDRTFYGDLRFEQRGGWGNLLKSWLWVWLPVAVAAGGVVVMDPSFAPQLFERIAVAEPGPAPIVGGDAAVFALAAVILLPFWVVFAWIRHQVFSFRYLISNRTLQGEVGFTCTLGVWAVIGVYLGGAVIIVIAVSILSLVVAGAVALAIAATGGAAQGASLAAVVERIAAGEAPPVGEIGALALFGAAYLVTIAVYVALAHAFISHPLLKRAARTLTIHNLAAAGRARQRAHDEQAEAGGFADALGADVGGAF